MEYTPSILRALVQPSHLRSIRIMHSSYLNNAKVHVAEVHTYIFHFLSSPPSSYCVCLRCKEVCIVVCVFVVSLCVSVFCSMDNIFFLFLSLFVCLFRILVCACSLCKMLDLNYFYLRVFVVLSNNFAKKN